MIFTLLRRGYLKKEAESFWIRAQNNAIRNNYIKDKICKTQDTCKCRFTVQREREREREREIFNEYKRRQDCVGTFKRLNFDHIN